MRRFVNLVLLMLGMLPLPLLLGCHFFPDRLWLCGLFSVLYLALGFLCIHIQGKKRVFIGLVCCAALLAAGLWLLPWQTSWPVLLMPLAYIALLLYTLPMGGWDGDQDVPLNISFVGLAMYIPMQLMLLTPMKTRYAPVAGVFLLCFIAYLVLWLLLLNRLSLTNAAASRGRTPFGMRRRNTVLTLLFAALLLFISAIPAIAEWLAAAWYAFRDAVAAVFRWLMSLLPAGETTTGGGGGGNLLSGLGGEVAEPSAFAKFMEKVAIVLAIVATLALLLWAGRILWRKLRVLFAHLWTLLQRYTLAASEDYVDEVSDTRENGDDSLAKRRRALRRRLRQVNEERLSPSERIRYRYQRLLWKRLEWGPSTTARENLPGETACLYEKARYSTASLTAEEAERFAQNARALEKKP